MWLHGLIFWNILHFSNQKSLRLDFYESKLTNCMEKFYDSVYRKRYECTAEYDYLTRNLSEKYIAFTLGSVCFHHVVHRECDKDSTWFLRNHYSIFLNSFTNKPSECGIFWKLQALECKPILMTLLKKFDEGEDVDGLLELCEDLETCSSSNHCSFAEFQLENIKKSCESLRFQSVPMVRCYEKLAYKPGKINNSCLNGHDFFHFSKEAICQNSKKKQYCVKKILRDYCGFSAVESYEEHLEKMKSVYSCDKNM